MTRFFFPDNTVLVNFGHIGRYDALRALLNGKGRWCATVAQECAASAEVAGLEDLHQSGQVFGEAIRPEPAELIDARVLRDRISAPGDAAYAHLGEAETVAIMARRFSTSFFVTDDGGAATIARAEGLTVVTTWDLLKACVASRILTADELWADLQVLSALGRGWPPRVRDRRTFQLWLGAGAT